MNPFALILMSATVGGDSLGETLRQNFSGGAVSETLFKRVGPEPKRFMKGDAAGLRITLPGKEAPPPIGVASRLAVHGDFEITASYRLLKVDKPTNGYGAGVSLWIAMETPEADAATLARFIRPKGGDVFSMDHASNDSEGKRKHKELYVPTDAKTGKLRLTRSGSTLVYLATQGNDAPFQELRREEFGAAPLKGVRIAADTGGAPVEVDVVLVDLEIRSSELSASTASGRQTSGTGRLIWIVGLVIGATLGLGGLLYWRRRRGQAESPGSA